ncbi:MAG: translation initiation factor IF-2 [Eubacterium sp.]|nr:translation initiation factor IF-2 [Eubacterium sp.]
MTVKVFELAKEMGVQSKELLAKAKDLGIDVKSHMSALSDADVSRLKGGDTAQSTKTQTRTRKPPIGKPIVDEKYLASKRKPPIGKPVVDNEMLARREKQKAEAAEAEKTAKAAPKEEAPAVEKKEAPAAEQKEAPAAPEKKAEPAAEKKAAPAEEKKAAPAEEKKPQKPAAEKTEEKPAAQEPAKKPQTKAEPKKESKPVRTIHTLESEKITGIKVVKRAETVIAEQKAERTERAERRAKAAESRRNAGGDRKKSGENRGERGKDNRKGQNAGGRTGKDGENRPRRDGAAGRRNAEGGRGDNRGNARPARRDSGNAPAADSSGRKTGRRDDKKNRTRHDGDFRNDRTKFDKFEKKSLEKKERKKYNKTKPEVVEEVEEEILPEGTIRVNVPITVAGFCEQAEVSTASVIMTLMTKFGIMANINQNIDKDTLELLAAELGLDVVVGEVEEEEVEEGIEDFKDREKDLKPRPPIITVMGHVDHGKTSLLDAIRNTNVTASESGGITQHIGASEVTINGKRIVFLDTPGHEAFTAMRARGAHITDIAVLVVAADDSVKPQTIESISHAKAANVPIIVAINKMDKPGANPDRVIKDLADQGVLVEAWGGDVISVPVSAKTGEGITDLLEMILLQAEVLELKANPNRLAMGSVIEARLDKAKGPVASLLIMNGTLQAGQSIVAGTCHGRIRLMTNAKGETIKKSGPATAVEVLGLTDVPQAGDEFNAVRSDKVAREIADHRAQKLREEVLAKNSSMTLDKLFSQIQEGEVKELNLIIKADVQGSVGAMISSLEKLNNDQVKVNVVHSGVGTINESDIMLAGTSDAIIIGFNVRPSTAVTTMADQQGIEIRLYRVIYDVIDDVKAAMKGMLDPEFREEVLGKAEVRETFKVPGVGIIAGAYITEGKVVRNEEIRLVRDGIVIHEGKISSLKRYKDDAREVNQGYECGIGIESYNDLKIGDVIECFTNVEIKE